MQKSNLMTIVIIVLLVAILATVVGVGIYGFTMFRNMEAGRVEIAPWERDLAPPTLRRDEISEISIPAITTNLSSGSAGRDRIVRVKVSVGVNNTLGQESNMMMQMLGEREVTLQSIVLSVVRTRTHEQLLEPGGDEALLQEILVTLQEDFQSNAIVGVYLNEFLFQ